LKSYHSYIKLNNNSEGDKMGNNKFIKKTIAVSISLLMVLSNFTMQSYVAFAATNRQY